MKRIGRIVRKSARIFDNKLIIVGSLEQARRPSIVSVGKPCLLLVRDAVVVRVDEEIRIGVEVIHNRFVSDGLGVGQDGGKQPLAKMFDLLRDSFARIAVAIVIDWAYAKSTQRCFVGNFLVARGTIDHFDGNRVQIVTSRTSGVALAMLKPTGIGLTWIFISNTCQRAHQRRSGGAIMDIEEFKLGLRPILIKVCNRFVHADGGLDALMAGHAPRICALVVDLESRGEYDSCQPACLAVVASEAGDDGADWSGVINNADGGSVGAEVIQKARG